LSVDPDVAETGQPYAYTGDDPVNAVDPKGLDTVGICAGASGELGILNVSAGDCLDRTIDQSGEDDIGLVGTIGSGVGAGANGSVGVYYQISNATNLQELKGPFYYATIGGEVGGGATVTVFWNSSLSIYGIEVGVSAGLGADGAVGQSLTWVDQFYGTISANIARGVWDVFNPGLALAPLLRTAVKDMADSRDHCNDLVNRQRFVAPAEEEP
jgi:hypothetical protein